MCHFRHFPEKLIEAHRSVFQIKQDEDGPFTGNQALGGCIGTLPKAFFKGCLYFHLQLIILIYGVFSGKLGVKKWLILLNPVCGLIVGIVLGAVLPGSLSGIPMGMRNLGEGLMYLIPYAYWQNHRA